MSVRTDVVNLNININGNEAQNKLNELRKKAADVSAELKTLRKGTQEFANKSAELQKVNAEMTDLRKQIGLTSLTQKELIQELKKLNALKNSVQPFTQEFKELEKQIKATESRLYDVRNGVQGFASFWHKVNDEVKQFGMLAASYLGFQFITSQISNVIAGAGKQSDELANIRRKTSMTVAEVEQLNRDLKSMDTRTANSSLRDLAAMGGQLGIAKEQIAGFTAGLDKANVVMGDEFNNNVEDLTNSIFKVRNTFKGLQSDNIEDDLMRISNGLTLLAQNGVATAPITNDIASRIGAAGSVYGMAAAQTYGLAAAYQELAIGTERGSTATVKLLQKISAAPENFMAIVQSVEPSINSLEKFKELINKDITQAFLLVAKGFTANKGNATAFAESLADAEIGSAAIAEVLSKVGQNTSMVNEKIKLAGEGFKSTSAIMEQFNIKNNNFQAELDKLSKKFNELMTRPAVSNFLQTAIRGLSAFIDFLKDLPNWLSENRVAISATVTVLLAYTVAKLRSTQASILNRTAILLETAAQKLETIQTAASTVVKNTATFATAAYIIVTNLLTGKITIATAAQRLWNITIASFGGPVTATILAIGALITGIIALSGRTKELTNAQRLHLELSKKVTDAIGDEVSESKLLFDTLQKKNLSRDVEANLLNRLIKINPEYLSGLNAQNIRTAEGKKILDEYNRSLLQKAELEAQIDLYKEKRKRTEEIDMKLSALPKNNKQLSIGKIFSDLGAQMGLGEGSADYQAITLKQEANTLKADMNNLYKKIKNNLEKNVSTATGDDTKKATFNTLGKDDNKIDNIGKEAADFAQEMKQLAWEVEVNGKSIQEQEIERINHKYKLLTERAKKYHFDLAKIEGLRQKEIDQHFAEFVSNMANSAYEEQKAGANKSFDNKEHQINKGYAAGTITKAQQIAEIERNRIARLEELLQLAQIQSDVSSKAAEDIIKTETDLTAALVQQRDRRDQDDANRTKESTKEKEQQRKEDIREQRARDRQDRINANRRVQMYKMLGEAAVSFFRNLNGLLSAIHQKRIRQIDTEADTQSKKDKALLDSKLIHESVYQQRSQALEEEKEKKKEQLQKNAALREKAISIFESTINAYQAYVTALATVPPPGNILAANLALGLGLTQVGFIAAAPLQYGSGTGSLLRNGPLHSDPDKGLHIVNPRTGRIEAMAERGEILLNRNVNTDNRPVSITGTPRQIASAVNTITGGISFDGGAIVNLKPQWNTNAPRINYRDVMRYYGMGGSLQDKAVSNSTNTGAGLKASNNTGGNSDSLILQELRNLNNGIIYLTRVCENYPKEITGKWVLRDLQRAQEVESQIKKSSGITR